MMVIIVIMAIMVIMIITQLYIPNTGIQHELMITSAYPCTH